VKHKHAENCIASHEGFSVAVTTVTAFPCVVSGGVCFAQEVLNRTYMARLAMS
jgi:hypothetical protein